MSTSKVGKLSRKLGLIGYIAITGSILWMVFGPPLEARKGDNSNNVEIEGRKNMKETRKIRNTPHNTKQNKKK